jgi:4,5-DOPA dioxygenase extradiol
MDRKEEDYRFAVPSPDHFLPLLYVLGVRTKDDKATFFNDSLVGGSLSMTSLMLAQP